MNRSSSKQRYLLFVDEYRHRRIGNASRKQSKSGHKVQEPSKAERADGSRSKGRPYLREYLRWLWPHRHSVGALLLLALTGTALQMLEPLFMRFIVDNVLLNNRLDSAARFNRVNTAGTVFLSLVIGSNLINALKEYRQRAVNARIMIALRRSLLTSFLRLPLPKLWEMKTGGILSRLTGDVDTTTGVLQLTVISPILSVVRVTIATFILMTLNWRLALAALAVVPAIMVVSILYVRGVRPIYRSVQKDAEAISGSMGETFLGIRVVRAFRRELTARLDYIYACHTMLRKEMFAQRGESVVWTSWNLVMGSVNVAIFWYGGYLNVRGSASIGDIMAFQWYTFLLLHPLWTIVNSFSELQRSLAAMERVFEGLAMEDDMPDRPNACEAPDVVNTIRLENVGFEYFKGRPVIKDFDVSVPGGSVIALVGRSGAGKTTVADLMARFHDPTKGRILVNGRDIRDFRLKSYRRLIAIVQQDVFLFDGSVADNIAYGRLTATGAEVEDAARRANAHEFIMKLPEHYDTFIGEHGVKLSGGQQQRLAIARATLAAPQILILDEATSNLDTESEQLIQASLATLVTGRTTFVIAHRLSTVREANLILLMDDGRILERGNHDELMSARGLYHSMVVRQMESHGLADGGGFQ